MGLGGFIRGKGGFAKETTRPGGLVYVRSGGGANGNTVDISTKLRRLFFWLASMN